ncbi:MAG: hypothetical protein U0792_11705 [Gemmataceae bacterium]
MVQIAAWPDRQIVVVATRKSDVHHVYNALATEMRHDGRLCRGSATGVGERVIVATPAALGLGIRWPSNTATSTSP